MIDRFVRFNRKTIDDRQIDTLIGLSKGLIADGKVDQMEAEVLHTWLIQSRQCSNNPVIENLLEKVSVMLEDGILDPEESNELLSVLRKITGDPSEVGELAKTTSLPIDTPLPVVTFPNHAFLFTGTCAFGTRSQCHDATEALGGVISTGVTKAVNYLVLGTYVTDSWIHETFGRKIEKAMTYRDSGVPIRLVTEEHWATSGKLV